MNGKTHVGIGLATSALVLPHTESKTFSIMLVLAAIGSLMPDIDKENSKISNMMAKAMTIAVAIMVLGWVNLKKSPLEVMTSLVDIYNPGIYLIVGLMIFSRFTEHRSFTHSSLGAVLFTAGFYMTFKWNCLGFAIGYIAHLVADMLTITGIEPAYPRRDRIALKWISTNSNADHIICTLAYMGFACLMM